jgi:hypothetical protein
MKFIFVIIMMLSNLALSQIGIGIEYNNSIDSQINLVTGTRQKDTVRGRRTDIVFGAQSYDNTNNTSYNKINIGIASSFLYPLRQMVQFSIGGRADMQLISDKNNYNNGGGIDHNPYTVGLITGLVFSPSYHPDYEIYAQIRALSSEDSGYNNGTSKSNPNASTKTFFNKGAIGIKYYL